MNKKTLLRYRCTLLFVLCGLIQVKTFGQSTPQPTQIPGSNLIERNADGKIYTFSFNGIPMFRYNIMPNGFYRGNFNGLSASRDGRDYFIPAICGGVLAVDGKRIVYPCEDGVSYTLENQFINTDSITLLWGMYWNNTKLYGYRMSLQMKGKTLVIDIEGNDDNRNGAGITLGEAQGKDKDLVVVPVPYLPLTSLLYQKSTQTFTSMFFDWERTNCSRILPLGSLQNHVLFSQTVEYFPRTDGIRNKLKERIYLTVSSEVNEVMPNVVGRQAQFKSVLQNKIILSYHQPFSTLLNPIIPGTSLPTYLDTLKNLGITDVALIVKDWWWSGYDGGNPNVLPANDYNMGDWACSDFQRKGDGGDRVLAKVREKARQQKYMFALHQNYVDMYFKSRPGAVSLIKVDSSLIVRLPDFGNQLAWSSLPNCRGENALAIKPSCIIDVAGHVASSIYHRYQADWNYLDVISSPNPSGPFPIQGYGTVNSFVDFDASRNNAGNDSAGMFLYTLRKYRTVPQVVRENTKNSPVQGEGGNHFLYVGYFDDFEARIKTSIPNIGGYSAPLFLDFHLMKLRSKSAFHGAGHIYEFYDHGWNAFFTDKEVLCFIATELAYGHGGLVTKSAHNCLDSSLCDHSLKQIELEYKHVLPMQKLLINTDPINIFYFDTTNIAKTSSQYITDHPNEFADIHSRAFMGRVKIEYRNGVVVYVNRGCEIAGNWSIAGLPSGGWYNYNVKLRSTVVHGVGAKPSEPLVLPPECGWVCYSPL
jgi:hypothetical protein